MSICSSANGVRTTNIPKPATAHSLSFSSPMWRRGSSGVLTHRGYLAELSVAHIGSCAVAIEKRHVSCIAVISGSSRDLSCLVSRKLSVGDRRCVASWQPNFAPRADRSAVTPRKAPIPNPKDR